MNIECQLLAADLTNVLRRPAESTADCRRSENSWSELLNLYLQMSVIDLKVAS